MPALIRLLIAVGPKLISGAGRGITKIFSGIGKLFRRRGGSKGGKDPKLPKNTKQARAGRNNRLRRWGRRIGRWLRNLFRNNVEDVQETPKVIETQETPKVKEEEEEEEKQEKQGYIKRKFFYKEEKFSENKLFNRVLNDYNRKNELKNFKLKEIDERIDFIFNKVLEERKKSRDRGLLDTAKDKKGYIDDLPLPEEEPPFSIWDLLRFLLRFKLRLKARWRRFKYKVKRFFRNIKNKIKRVRRIIKQKIEEARKRREAERKRKEEERKRKVDSEKNKTNNRSNKTNTNTKGKQYTPSDREVHKNIKDPPKSQTTSSSSKTKPTKYPDLEEALQEPKKAEIETEKRIKQLQKEYDDGMRNANKEIARLRKEYDATSAWRVDKLGWIKTQIGAQHVIKEGLDKITKAQILWEKGKGLYELANSFKDAMVKKVKNMKEQVKIMFPKMFAVAAAGAKAMAPIVKRIPLIGSVLYAVISVFNIAHAKNGWEVRRSLGEGIGGAVGGIVGGVLGSFLPLIGNLIFGIIGSLIGEAIGRTAVQFGLEPLDFLPFENYDSSLDEKKQMVKDGYDYSKRELQDWSKRYVEPLVNEAYRSGKYLDTSERKNSLTTNIKKASASVVNAVGLGNEETQMGGGGNTDYSFGGDVNPEAIEGSVIRVTRTRMGVDWQGRGFTHGTMQAIDGTGKVLFEATTTEHPFEGTASGANLRIPPGTYNMYWGNGSKHPDRPVLFNDKVSASRAVMIHKGNSVAWTAGCVVISRGDTWKGLVGQTGDKAAMEKAGEDLMVVAKKLSGQDPSKKYPGVKLGIKVQIFNNIPEADITAAKKAAASEKYHISCKKTVNKTTVNNTTVIHRNPPAQNRQPKNKT